MALAHGFHPTKQDVHFTISEAARVEVLDRRLEFNHLRYGQEAATRLHDKGQAKKEGAGKNATKKTSAIARLRPPSAPSLATSTHSVGSAEQEALFNQTGQPGLLKLACYICRREERSDL